MAVLAYKVKDYIEAMERLAPSSLAADWDNVGLQAGHPEQPVQRVLVCLTITEALTTAMEERFDLIVVHHPLIFKPLRSLRWDRPEARPLVRLSAAGTAVLVCHTNLDHAAFGLNYWLAERFGLSDLSVLDPLPDHPEAGLGRIGNRSPIALPSLVKLVQKQLGVPVRFVGNENTVCQRVAVCGGSGGRLIEKASSAHADVLITGDVDYHDALLADSLGLALLDAGHYGTERLMVDEVAAYLQECYPTVTPETSLLGADPWHA